MSRRNAFTLGVVLWALSLLWGTTFEDVSVRAIVVWGIASAVVIALATVAARAASRALRNAAGDDA
ncbi:MAG TPA: hypothetical protein VGX28_09420 [Frankiaceae bacterium]|jgi:hypothetical protein|nr:hypothetical protein [Frankiaceae bacterium]